MSQTQWQNISTNTFFVTRLEAAHFRPCVSLSLKWSDHILPGWWWQETRRWLADARAWGTAGPALRWIYSQISVNRMMTWIIKPIKHEYQSIIVLLIWCHSWIRGSVRWCHSWIRGSVWWSPGWRSSCISARTWQHPGSAARNWRLPPAWRTWAGRIIIKLKYISGTSGPENPSVSAVTACMTA